MPAATADPIDFKHLKRQMMGADAASPVACAVGVYPDKSVGLLVDKKKSPKALVNEMKKTGPSGHFLFGAAYIDTYPGALCLTLNRTPGGLKLRLREALRGSGFGKVELVATEEDEGEG